MRHCAVVFAAAMIAMCSIGAQADALLQHRGRCQSLTVFDRNVAAQCEDRMISQVGALGERGFVFQMTDGVVVFFVAIDAPPRPGGTRTLPLNRIDFGLRGQVETIPVLSGMCV